MCAVSRIGPALTRFCIKRYQPPSPILTKQFCISHWVSASSTWPPPPPRKPMWQGEGTGISRFITLCSVSSTWQRSACRKHSVHICEMSSYYVSSPTRGGSSPFSQIRKLRLKEKVGEQLCWCHSHFQQTTLVLWREGERREKGLVGTREDKEKKGRSYQNPRN